MNAYFITSSSKTVLSYLVPLNIKMLKWPTTWIWSFVEEKLELHLLIIVGRSPQVDDILI